MDKSATALTQRLGNIEISEELRRQILPYADKETLVVVNPNVAAVITPRSEWGSSGGIGRYDQVRVFCGSQSAMQEWQYRDRYSESADRPLLAVDGLGEVKVSERDNKVVVEVELVNNHRGRTTRTATFTFDQSKETVVRVLSAEEQAIFSTKVEQEMARIMVEFEQQRALKPQMRASYPEGTAFVGAPSHRSYRPPSIKQTKFRYDIGVAAFVTDEQIGHKETNPMIRYELYVLTFGNEKAESKARDHGCSYEGGAFLTILEIEPDRIVINTNSGKKTILLGQP